MTEDDKQLRAYLANMSPEDAADNAHWLDEADKVLDERGELWAKMADAKPPKTVSQLELRMSLILDRLSTELNLPAIEAEYRFNPARRHRADFAIPEMKMLIECEGGQWTRGRHTRGKGFEDDCEKYNLATSLGWQVYRFTGDMIRDGRAEAFLRSIIPPF